ncbi:hypothetical protein KIL84_021313 [Mauremys mutica]|uniref:Uncharacterized protein n=1 Tax=Mauremys mutica TaxID=74926 RepID=A0A9D4B0R5_9SAUR|nr:hypothetical protein KIL84_021313 [Mauremys mutica]
MTLSSHLSIAKTYICPSNKMFLRDSNGYLESGSYYNHLKSHCWVTSITVHQPMAAAHLETEGTVDTLLLFGGKLRIIYNANKASHLIQKSSPFHSALESAASAKYGEERWELVRGIVVAPKPRRGVMHTIDNKISTEQSHWISMETGPKLGPI